MRYRLEIKEEARQQLRALAKEHVAMSVEDLMPCKAILLAM